MIPAIAAGQFDIGMDGITITEERAQQVDFSTPTMTSQQFMLTRAGEDRFATPQDFAGDAELLVGAQPGTSGFYTAVYDILDGDDRTRGSSCSTTSASSVQALHHRGRGHGAGGCRLGRGDIGANPEMPQIVGDAIKTEDFGFIFPPGSEPMAPSWTLRSIPCGRTASWTT